MTKSSTTSSKTSSKTALKTGRSIRLNSFLAKAGLGSRRKVEELISSSQIMINGVAVTGLSTLVDPERDKVSYQGKEVSGKAELHYLLINKPRGYVVSQADELKRKTIYDLLPEFAARLKYAGRLDKESEGLLLLTNDGAMIQALTHPSRKVEKVYKAVINKKLGRYELEQLRRGVQIDGGKTLPAGIFEKKNSEQGSTLKVVIKEGRKRQIRLMIEAVGARVLQLRRLQFGPLKLGTLPLGMWRSLTHAEVKALRALIKPEKDRIDK